MKIKLLALSILFATTAVHAEQMKVPSLEVLRNRIDVFTNAHPEEGSIARILLEESEFLAEFADKELDSAYVASRLCAVAVIFGAMKNYFILNYNVLVLMDLSDIQAHVVSGVLAKQQALRLLTLILKLNLEKDSSSTKALFTKFIDSDLAKGSGYCLAVSKLYDVFFQDYPNILKEESEKLFSNF